MIKFHTKQLLYNLLVATLSFGHLLMVCSYEGSQGTSHSFCKNNSAEFNKLVCKVLNL